MKRYIICIFAALTLIGCATSPPIPEKVSESVNPAPGVSVVNAAEGVPEKAHTVYSTKYNEKSNARAHNIKLAAEKINGTVIEAGDTFSFNETVGPAGSKNGYKKARIFIRGQDAEGYGGGICQVSSTLYNCALELGLDIVERHPHSKKVGYVPEDRDAATSYGGKDLKFVNSLDVNLVVTSSASDGVLKIELSQETERS